MRRDTNPHDAVHIGNPRGKIALWLDETDANSVAMAFSPNDLIRREIGAAIAEAYPSEASERSGK